MLKFRGWLFDLTYKTEASAVMTADFDAQFSSIQCTCNVVVT